MMHVQKCLATVLTSALLISGLVLLAGCGSGGGNGEPPPPPGTVVPGTVIDEETTDPIANARVVIGGKVGTSGADGSFEVREVPFGTGTPPTQPLTVTAAGYVTNDHLLTLVPDRNVQDPVTVTLTPADTSLTGTMSGTVTTANPGAPIARALVEFTSVPGEPVSFSVRGHTDDNGFYSIGGVPSGSAVANAIASDFLLESRTVLVIADDEGTNDPVDFALTSGTSMQDVSGLVVTLETQAPLPGALVQLGERPAVTTNAAGEFTVTAVPVGPQNLEVSASGHDPFLQTVEVRPDMAPLRVELPVTDTTPPGTPFTIAGTVVVLNQGDNAGVTVTATLVSTSEELDRTVTNAEGAYGLFVPPGTYTIEASIGPNSASTQVTLPGAGSVITGVDFALTAP